MGVQVNNKIKVLTGDQQIRSSVSGSSTSFQSLARNAGTLVPNSGIVCILASISLIKTCNNCSVFELDLSRKNLHISRQWLTADDVILLVVLTGEERGGNILMDDHVRFPFRAGILHIVSVVVMGLAYSVVAENSATVRT
ncbi:hypothetical protein WH47_03616 [Habropoda laboriosa]|uniref:Uncharacterized protein n=1 Tax=Habropoda laboriosa TaxID=597456 RepID=A0A0L7RIA9_9HYME|nr:hypothetical protein WH47_03616 [Habropoda laboriosa]